MEPVREIDNLWQDNQDSFDKLVDTALKYPTAFLAGAGISKRAGYPIWSELLEILHQEVQALPGYEEFESSFPAKGEELKRAMEYREILGEKYYEVIYERFTDDTKYAIQDFAPIHKYLLEIEKFQCTITTNYDICLERASDIPRSEWFPELNPVLLNRKLVFHIHGYIEPGNRNSVRSIILDENDYSEAYNELHDLHNFLVNCFRRFNIVFLGFSMEDENLLRKIQYVKDAVEYNNKYSQDRGMNPIIAKKHFAILADTGEDHTAFDKSLSELGVEPIRFKPTEHFKEYKDVIGELKKRLSEDMHVKLAEPDPMSVALRD